MPLGNIHNAELEFLLRRNIEIVRADAIRPNNPLLISAVGEIAVNLRECLRTLEVHCGLTCSATHDLGGSTAENVGSLVARLRHSYVHSTTTRLNSMEEGENRLSWNFFFGRAGGMRINQIVLECPYEDDLGINFGQNVILFFRHMLLAHNYCAYAFNHLGQRDPLMPAEYFSAPAILNHPFWLSAENDLRDLGIQF